MQGCAGDLITFGERWMRPKNVTPIPPIALCTCFLGYRGSAAMPFNGREMEMGREERKAERELYI